MSRPHAHTKRWRSSWMPKGKKQRRVLWRTGRVIEDGAGKKALRLAVYQRAEGRCEVVWDGKRCNKFAAWDGHYKGDLIHLKDPIKGHSDEPELCEWGCHSCHMRRDHPGPQFGLGRAS